MEKDVKRNLSLYTYVFTYVYKSCCCIFETNITLKINYISKNLKNKVCSKLWLSDCLESAINILWKTQSTSLGIPGEPLFLSGVKKSEVKF